MKSSRDIQKTPSSDPWAMSSNLSSGVHRGDASDQSPVQENRPHGLRRRTSLWKIDKFINLLLHQKRFRECRVLLRRHSDISQEPLLHNYHQLQQWSEIRSSETIRHYSHPRGRDAFGQGLRVVPTKSFATLGTSMIYRKLKLVRNFKKSIQPNKSWEGNGSRKTVKLSFSYQVGCYVHLIPWTSFTSSTEYAWCVWRPTEAKTGSSCGCVSPPHDAPIKKLQVLNTRPHLHSIKRDESFTTIVQERHPASKLYISSGERTLERTARPGKAEETESSLFLSRYSLTGLLARAAHAWLLTTPLNWELAPRLHKTPCQDLTI